MKRTNFVQIPVAVISITGAELGRLMALSRLHYDGKCRMIREVGGFLYGMCNQWIFHHILQVSPFDLDEGSHRRSSLTDEQLRRLVEIRVTADELGLLAKVSELESMYCSDGQAVSMMLLMQFTGIFAELSAEYDRLNPSPSAATEGQGGDAK